MRWQNPRDVVWNEARAGQPLYAGQSLMTLSGSTARLDFDADSSLDVAEKSLIQLETPIAADAGEALVLSLVRGDLKARTARPLVVSAGKFEIRLEPGASFAASRDGEGALRLRLESGNARAVDTRTDGAAPLPLGAGQAIEIPREGGRAVPIVRDAAGPSPAASPVAETAPATTIAPAPRATSPIPRSSPHLPAPRSSLRPPPPRAPQRLPAPRIHEPVFRPRSAPKPAPTGAKPNGSSGAKPNGSSGAKLDARSRSPLLAATLEVLRASLGIRSAAAADPAPGDADASEWEIELRWDPVPDARRYRVQVSRTRGFSTRIAEETVTAPQWVWLYRRGMENSRGRVFYRIAAIDAEGRAGAFSAPRPFAIPREILRPASPAIAGAPPARAEAPKPAPSPTPPAAASAASIAPRGATPPRARWSIRPSVEYRSQSQTSDYPLLRDASPSGGFVHEALRLERIGDFTLALSLRASHYEKRNGPVSDTTPLAKTRSFEGRFGVLVPYARDGAGWRRYLRYGVSLFGEDRFGKDGANALRLRRAFSLGPAIGLRNERGFVRLHLPITGWLAGGSEDTTRASALGGPYGATLEAQVDWPLARLGAETRLLVSAGAEGSWHFWKSPPDTTVKEWAVGVGPKVVFE